MTDDKQKQLTENRRAAWAVYASAKEKFEELIERHRKMDSDFWDARRKASHERNEAEREYEKACEKEQDFWKSEEKTEN